MFRSARKVGCMTHDGVTLPMPCWAATLGQQHGARARAADLATQAAHTAAVNSADMAVLRWPRIVEAMARLVTAYNTGFESEVLKIVEDQSASRPVVTIRTGGADDQSLVVTLEESVICARRSDAGVVSCETEQRLRADRDDDETAAYVLQHWMEHL